MSDQRNNNNNLSTFLAGVILGAGLTYLFGTKSGQKFKEELLKEGKTLLEKLSEELEQAKENPKLEEAEEKIQEGLENIQEAAGNVEEKIQDTVADIPRQAAEVQKKGRRFFFRRFQAHQSPVHSES